MGRSRKKGAAQLGLPPALIGARCTRLLVEDFALFLHTSQWSHRRQSAEESRFLDTVAPIE